MTNLLAPQTDEICYVTVEDVRDSLREPISLLTDTEIEILIVDAQKQVNVYLNSINPDIPCTWIVDTDLEDNCYNGIMVSNCDDVPIDIKRATLQIIDNIYTSEKNNSTDSTYVDGKRIIKETSACGVELTYQYESLPSDCQLIDCWTSTLLECYELKTSSIWFNCKPCPSTCKPCK